MDRLEVTISGSLFAHRLQVIRRDGSYSTKVADGAIATRIVSSDRKALLAPASPGDRLMPTNTQDRRYLTSSRLIHLPSCLHNTVMGAVGQAMQKHPFISMPLLLRSITVVVVCSTPSSTICSRTLASNRSP